MWDGFSLSWNLIKRHNSFHTEVLLRVQVWLLSVYHQKSLHMASQYGP